MSPGHIPKGPAVSKPTLALLGLVVLLFLAFFRRIPEFGLYGDDAALFEGLINRTWSEELGNVLFSLTMWPQDRPLGMGLNLGLIPYTVFDFMGLSGLHAVAFLFVAVNCVLLYRLINQYYSPLVALSAAGFYALAPADTVVLSCAPMIPVTRQEFQFKIGISVQFGPGICNLSHIRGFQAI